VISRAAVHAVNVLLLLLSASPGAAAQPPVEPADEEPGIQDNSFLIEEAYNQEPGVVQHINGFTRLRGSGEWAYTFTQEWPAPGIKHQLSYTVPVAGGSAEGGRGIGDVALNYRYQWIGSGDTALAVAPRLTLLLPTGSVDEGLGTGAVGFQLNLPMSTVLSRRWVAHWNAGATFTPSAEDAAGQQADIESYNLGQSFIWEPSARLNFMLETVWTSQRTKAAHGEKVTEESLLVSPGIRWAYNFSSGLQIVPGIAFPIGIGPSDGDKSVFLYLSFEHPFRKVR
jgi:outer membrane putative beta-barrel porin/alpha-amylase